jgi:hypothetical protein
VVLGSTLGLAGGYLVARRQGWEGGGDWARLGTGVGVGAVAGGLLGLGVASVERARGIERPWSVLYGAAGLTSDGVFVGALVGAAAAYHYDDREEILHFASLGALAGGGFGLLVATWATFFSPATTVAAPAVSLVAGRDGRAIWLPAIAARY